MSRLDGRTVIVTGGAHGIGRAFCESFVARGSNVVVADIDGPGASEVAGKLGETVAISALLDVRDLDACHAVAGAALDAFGRIDGLVNNAAVYSRIPISRDRFDHIDPDEWDQVMAVNVKGSWQMCRAVVPHMEAVRYGKIVNMSSGTAFKGPAGRCHYVTSKAAVLGMTKTLARELGAAGIRVNAIAPGSTLSEEDPDEETLQLREKAVSRRSLPLLERPEDLSGTAAFLLSEDSDFLTGQTIVVDGGEYMH